MDPNEPTLFEVAPIPVAVPTNPGSTEDNFRAFHAANPWVYDAIVKLARDMKRRGRKKLGINMLFEVTRWEFYRATSDPASEFKINNNYAPHYSRLVMKQNADLDGMFELRRLRS